MISLFLEAIRKYRVAIYFIYFVLLIVSIAGITKLKITPDNRVFYGSHNPQYSQLLEYESEFTSNSIIGLAIFSPYSLETSGEFAKAIQLTTNAARRLPFAAKVESIVTVPHIILEDNVITNIPTLEFICGIDLKQCDSAKVGTLNRPEIHNRLMGKNNESALVVISLSFDVGSSSQLFRIDSSVHHELDKLKLLYPEFEFYFVGSVPLMKSFLDSAKQDMSTTITLAVIAIFICIYIAFGSLYLTGLVLALGCCTILFTLGLAGWLDLVLNTASATIPLILIVISITLTMHIILYALRSAYEYPNRDMITITSAAMETQAMPTILTAGTTVFGFASLVSANSPPISDIGIWCALGTTIGVMTILVMMPLLLDRMKRPKPSFIQIHLQTLVNNFAKKIERGINGSVIGLVIIIVSAIGISNLKIDDNFISYIGESTKFRQETDLVTKYIGGPNRVELVLDSGKPNQIYSPEFIAFSENVVEFVRTHPTVDSAFSFTDILKTIHSIYLPADEFRSLQQDEIAQLHLTHEISLLEGQSSNDFANLDLQKARISVILKDVTAEKIRGFASDVKRMSQDPRGIYSVTVTGESIPISYLSILNIKSVLLGIVSSLVLSSVLLTLYFRNMRIGIVTLISTMLPVLFGFGLWGIFKESIGLATTVIISASIGIVIDDAIHLIYRYFYGLKRLDLDDSGAAAYSIQKTGVAMIITSIVFSLGFGLLLLSDFAINQTFGACTTLVVLSALVIDFLMLPKMLIWATNLRTVMVET